MASDVERQERLFGGRIQGELEFGSRVQYATVHEHEAAEALVVVDGLDDRGADVHVLRAGHRADLGQVRYVAGHCLYMYTVERKS